MAFKRNVSALIGTGLLMSRMYRLMLADDAIIVCFHRVTDEIPEDGLTKSSASFTAFCQFFRRHHDVIPLLELAERVRAGAPLAGSLAITFDDGYADNCSVAAPILHHLRLPATFFVTTGFIGSDTVPWWDAHLPRRLPWMTWDDVRQLHRQGFDIGGHTRTHPDLGQLTGDAAYEEIAGCHRDLTRELGVAPTAFAYPYGQREHLVEENRDHVRHAGFRVCCSNFGGLVRRNDDPLAFVRVPITDWIGAPSQLAFDCVTRRF